MLYKYNCMNRMICMIKVLVLLSLLFFKGFATFAQVQLDVVRQNRFDGPGDDFGAVVKSTSDGGTLIAGTVGSPNMDAVNYRGKNDIVLVRMDVNGKVLWKRCYGGSEDDIARDMVQTDDGGFIVTSISNSYDGDIKDHPILQYGSWYCPGSGAPSSNLKVWIFKVDASGQIVWSFSSWKGYSVKGGGGTYPAYTNTISKLSDGNYVCDLSSRVGTPGSLLNVQLSLLRFTETGTVISENVIDYPYGASSLDVDDKIFCNALLEINQELWGVGMTGKIDDSTRNLVFKSGLNGSVESLWKYSGTDSDRFYGMCPAGQSAFVVAGSWGSSVSFLEGTQLYGAEDFFLMKLNLQGEVLWKKCYGGSGSDIARSVRPASDGGFYLIGNTRSIDGLVPGRSSGDHSDIWVVKTDSLGNLQWSKVIGGEGNEQVLRAVDGPSGSIYASGNITQNESGTPVAGSSDLLLLKLQQCSGVLAAPQGINRTSCSSFNLLVEGTVPPGNTIDWYPDAVGGEIQNAGSALYHIPPTFSTATTLFAETRDTVTGCISPFRTPVTATYTLNPSSPALFESDTLRVFAASYLLRTQGNYSRYLWSTGETTAVIKITKTGMYRCMVANGDCSIVDSVFVSVLSARITTTGSQICPGASVRLSAEISGEPVMDIDGTSYKTVRKGSQLWLQQNLSTSTFRNGDPVPREWWYWYNNDSARYAAYGKLYRYEAVTDSRGLAPEGFRIMKAEDISSIANQDGVDFYPAGVRYPFTEPYLGGCFISSYRPLRNFYTYGGFADFGTVGNWWLGGMYNRFYRGYYDGNTIRQFNFTQSEDALFSNYAFHVKCLRDDAFTRYTYNWSNGDTTAAITVAPVQTTTYFCRISDGVSTRVDSVTVVVRLPSQVTQTVSSCGYYRWNGKTYNQSGTYTYTTRNQHGCDSVVRLALTINTASANLFSQDTLRVCGSSYTLTAPTGYTTYLWNTAAITRSITVTATGWYRCVASRSTCVSDSVFISLIRANIVNADTSICPGDTAGISLTAVNSVSNSVLAENGTPYPALSFVLDFEGNRYPTVQIDDQLWMQKNLSTARFSDGSPIPEVRDQGQWSSLYSRGNLPGWCWYNNDSVGFAGGGRLYNGGAISRGVAPDGWHVPDALESSRIVFDLQASTSVATLFSPTNSGIRIDSFEGQGSMGDWWTTSVYPYLLYQYGSGPRIPLAVRDSQYFRYSIRTSFPYPPSIMSMRLSNSGMSVRCLYDKPLQKIPVRYLWSTGDTTATIEVRPTVTTTYYCLISDDYGNSCRDSVRVTVSSGAAPPVPVAISGPADICPVIGRDTLSQSVTYSIRSVRNASSYLWNLPSGVVALSALNDTLIRVAFRQSYQSGTITVASVNRCGVRSSVRSISILKRTAPLPGTIQQQFSPVTIPAATSVCGMSSAIYRIRRVSWATAYNWSLRSGSAATLTSLNGPGINDTAVLVNFSPGFIRDTLQVSSANSCSVSGTRSLAITTQSLPPAISAVISSSGDFAPCAGNVLTYTASSASPTLSQSAVSRYRWTLPLSVSIISANTDSSSVSLRFNAGFTGGSFSVRTVSACGIPGTARTTTFLFTTPVPASITSSSGSFNACSGFVVDYTVVPAALSAGQRAPSVYRWTIPARAVVIGSTADSSRITVQYSPGFTGGNLSVRGQTSCGSLSAARTAAISAAGCLFARVLPGNKTNTMQVDNESAKISVFPNPTHSYFTLRVVSEIKGSFGFTLIDLQGRRLFTTPVKPMQTVQFGQQLNAGVYFVEIVRDEFRRLVKVVKL
jgi:uncharacterized protein (TIGR02145 family)